MHPSSERLFDSRVIDTVKLIPSGRLATYGQIADLVGKFCCALQVGGISRRQSLHRNDSQSLFIAEGIPVDA